MSEAQHARALQNDAHHEDAHHEDAYRTHQLSSPDYDYSDLDSPLNAPPYHPAQPNDSAELDRTFSYRRGDDAHGLNSRSYAARAGEPPELSIDTLPRTVEPAPEPFFSQPSTSAHRHGSVDHRSPLQKLEVTLGDLSKEEKRARAQVAEQKALQRGSTRIRAPAETQRSRDVESGPTSASTRPLGSYFDYNDSSPISPQTTDAQTPTRLDNKPRGANYNTLGAWERRYGYNAALGGAAAAQAVDAYQAAGQYYSSPRDGAGQPAIPRDDANGRQINSREAPTNGNLPDPTLSDQARAGPKPPKVVAFGPVETRDIASQPAEVHAHRFPMLHHRDPASLRRYQRSPSLADWKAAKAARLEAVDQDLDVDPTAWWEKGETGASRRKSGHRRQASNAPPSAYGFSHDGRMEKTSFRPPMLLKCGPLLRYAGINTDASGRKFWRGSIMIVTDDEASSYSTVPSLKLFKQPMDLARPPPPRPPEGNLGNLVHQQDDDPVAGLPKCSPTGETLYVKPVDMIKSNVDLSRVTGDDGLFEATALPVGENAVLSRLVTKDGEKVGKYSAVDAFRLHAERGFTFWRFNIEVELTQEQTRVAYRINHGPPTGFWVPARNQSMNIMFHSCNGFSAAINADEFSGPDPLWRDVLNQHQHRPFHVMLGGGDQIYNDAVMTQTEHFKEWLAIKNPEHKHSAPFTTEMQEELENFYLERYAMWFSQGMFGLANSQIPMVNMWDDHDIIDGFGSYPDHFMRTPVFSGIGGVAFKYYMLFQHQSLPDQDESTEPSWLLGAKTGPYIHERSRSLFMSLGKAILFLGIDCRTERMRDSILCPESYQLLFDRCHREVVKGETKHLIVLLGVPIAYPRLNFLENVLTSRLMDPIKALGRTGLLGGFVNKFDGGVEILDDLDDHWTAKHHKHERNWLIQALQQLAAEKSVRITILGGDVHLGAIGRFFSKAKLGVPKDHDHRYMPNIISSAIVNTPPPEVMADVLNGRNKIHHLDSETDEDMVPIFSHDVNGKARNNQRLLPRRNWCSIVEFDGINTAPEDSESAARPRPGLLRRLSLGGNTNNTDSNDQHESGAKKLIRRLSGRRSEPSAYAAAHRSASQSGPSNNVDTGVSGVQPTQHMSEFSDNANAPQRINSFQRRPSNANDKAVKSDATGRQGHIDLQGGLNITLNCEVDRRDPSGLTTQYSLIVPALSYEGPLMVASAARDEGHSVVSGFGRRFTLKRAANAAGHDSSLERGDLGADAQDHHYGRDAAFATGAAGLVGVGTHAFGTDGTGDTEHPADRTKETWSDEYERHLETNDVGRHFTAQNTEGAEHQRLGAQTRDMDLVDSPNPKDVNDQEFSQAPGKQQERYENEAYERERPDFNRRKSLKAGPPAPNNIAQLPASVRNRYSQFEERRHSSASDEQFDTARNSPEPYPPGEASSHDERDMSPQHQEEQEHAHDKERLSTSMSRRLQKTRPVTRQASQPAPSLARSQSLVQRLRQRFGPSQKHHDAIAAAPQHFEGSPNAQHTPWLHEAAQGSFGSPAHRTRSLMSQTRHQDPNGPLTSHSTGQQTPQIDAFAADPVRRESIHSDGDWMGTDASPDMSDETLEQPVNRAKPGKFERLAGVDVLGQHDTVKTQGRASPEGLNVDNSQRRSQDARQPQSNQRQHNSQHWRNTQMSDAQQPQPVRPYSGPGSKKTRPDLLPAPRPTGLGMSERAAKQLGYADGMPSVEQEGSWLERAQARAAENMNRRSSDSAAPPTRRNSWKRWI